MLGAIDFPHAVLESNAFIFHLTFFLSITLTAGLDKRNMSLLGFQM